jgi:hypothetical protein
MSDDEHKRGNYAGFSKEQHDKDVLGNNAAIKLLKEAIAKKAAELKKKKEEEDKKKIGGGA